MLLQIQEFRLLFSHTNFYSFLDKIPIGKTTPLKLDIKNQHWH